MHRRRRRRVKGLKIKKSILFLIILAIITFVLTKAYFEPPVMVYVKQKSYLVASKLINNAIMDQVVPNIDTRKLVIFESTSDGKVSTVTIDTYQANLLLSKMSKQIQDSINELEKNPNSELKSVTIPFSAMFSNPVMTFGPYIKVNMTIVGSVQSDLVSSVKPSGINNSLFEVYIKTKVKYQIAIPFRNDEIEVVTNTPILIKVIHGAVPHFYYSTPADSITFPHVPD